MNTYVAAAEDALLTQTLKVHYTADGRTSSNWRTLARKKKLSKSYLYDYLEYQAPLTHKTLAAGVDVIPSLRAIPPVTVPATRESFLTSVDSHLSAMPIATSWYHLSAGLDSSFLLLRAAQTGRAPQAATFRALGKGASDEIDAAQRIADHADAALTVFDFSNIDIFSAGRKMIESCPLYPIAHPSHLARFLLDHALTTQKGASHIISGRGIDECIGGYAWHTSEFSDASKHLSRVRSTDPSLLDHLFGGHAGEADAEYSTFFQNTGHTIEQRMAYDIETLHTAWDVIEQAFMQGLGFEYVLPFMDPHIISALQALPEEMKTAKAFLRRQFTDIYPPFVLDMPKMGLTFDMRAYMLGYSEDELSRIILDTHNPVLSLLDGNSLRAMLSETLSGKGNYGWQLWGVYLAGCVAEYAELTP